MAKKFPARLFVKIEEDSNAEYFVADDDAACLVEMGSKVKIAHYRLEAVQQAEGVASFSKFSGAKSVRRAKT